MSLQRIFNAFDNDFFGYPNSLSQVAGNLLEDDRPLFRSSVGACNIKESDNEFMFEIQAPGFGKNEILIDLRDNVLSVKGEHKTEREDKGVKYHRREVSHSSFSRKFSLPDNADTENIGAKMEHGILNLSVPKKAKVEPKKKEISIQ